MFTLGYGDDGRKAAAAEIKKALAGKPFRRDTMEKLSARKTGLTRDAAQGMFRKAAGSLTKNEKLALAMAVDRALKVALPPQSRNGTWTNVMPDTGGRTGNPSQFGVNDLVPKPDNGATSGVQDDSLAAIKAVHAQGPTQMFGR
jgi:hypothetical protein